MRIGLHRGRREVPLTADLRYDALVHCGSARALEMARRGRLWSAIGPLLPQHAVVQSGLPSHWDDHCCWLLLAAVCSQANVSFDQVSMNPQQSWWRTGDGYAGTDQRRFT
jgi:hypothetical protein